VWLSGNALVSINVITPRRAWAGLIHGWVTIRRQLHHHCQFLAVPSVPSVLSYFKDADLDLCTTDLLMGSADVRLRHSLRRGIK